MNSRPGAVDEPVKSDSGSASTLGELGEIPDGNGFVTGHCGQGFGHGET